MVLDAKFLECENPDDEAVTLTYQIEGHTVTVKVTGHADPIEAAMALKRSASQDVLSELINGYLKHELARALHPDPTK